MNVKLFTPPKFYKKKLDINYLNFITDKKWYYSVSGRASIYHILKNLKISKILIPNYICITVLEPLKRLNIESIFYDIDVEDLNSSLDSIKNLSEKYNIEAVLVASMYGNPANMIAIERYCKEKNIFLIDDAAQSFGAKLEDRYIGTFGDAGFFSFSSGKPTSGHMGSFFWTKNKIEINRKKHCLTHYLKWLDFKLNRYYVYCSYNNFFRKIVNLSSRFMLKMNDMYFDDICEFEKEIIGGVFYSNLEYKFRRLYHTKFIIKFKNSSYFRVVSTMRGESNPHKIVLIFYDNNIAKEFMEYMLLNNIVLLNGYSIFNDKLKNAKSIDKCVIELPIEDNEERMHYLFNKVEKFEY